MRRQNIGPCAYCGEPAQEVEHVFGRQFFPAEGQYRGDLVRVPACGTCNRAKQRVEDVAGVLIPFTGDSPASVSLLTGRIPRTLAKNGKISRILKIRTDIVPDLNGKFMKRGIIPLNDDMQQALRSWYIYIIQGLFRDEFKTNIRDDEILLFHLRGPQYTRLKESLLKFIKTEHRSKALGEVSYQISRSEDGLLSLWVLKIYGDEVLAITGKIESQQNRDILYKLCWK